MKFLLDTNVISELRKGKSADENVMRWFAVAAEQDLFLSVLVLGELRRGIENLRRRDERSAEHLEVWLTKIVHSYSDRILPITDAIADRWGRFNVPDGKPTVDALIAATAYVHDLTVVSRNVRDIARPGVATINPFLPA